MSILVDDAVNEFYKLKDTYERNNAIIKRKIIEHRYLSIKEKREEIKKLIPKCINCKRPGGTIFSIKLHKGKQVFRELKSICGIVADPCNLNITIELGIVELISEPIKETENSIKDIKNKIINDKNKLLFGQLSSEDALDNFNDFKEELTDYTSYLEILLEQYYNTTENKDDARKLSENITNSYNFIRQIKDSIKQFDETDNVQFVRDVVNIYEVDLKPLLKEIMKLKYKQPFVWYDDDTNEYKLMQHKYTIKEMEDYLTESKVQSFIVGYIPTNKKNKPVAKTAIDAATNKKTNKTDKTSKKPKIKLILEEGGDDDSGDDDVGDDDSGDDDADDNDAGDNNSGDDDDDKYIYINTSGGDMSEKFIINRDGSVTWNENKYQSAWNKINPETKEVLINDPSWMEYFVSECTFKGDNYETCEFVGPIDLLIEPPKLLENGRYDLGNTYYSEYFNKLDENKKKLLLSLFTTNTSGEKNYANMKQALNNMISESLHYT
jgi:hypothetical protein